MNTVKSMIYLLAALFSVSATVLNADDMIVSAERKTPAASKIEIQLHSKAREKEDAVKTGEASVANEPGPIDDDGQAKRLDEKQYRDARLYTKP